MSDHHVHNQNGGDGKRGGRRPSPIGKILGESLGDVLRFVPELAADLHAIRRATETMASEVRGMHSAVRRVEMEVQGLRGQVDGLDGRLIEVEQRMSRLEPHIADVNLAIRPLRRARARLPSRAADAAISRAADADISRAADADISSSS